MRQDADGNVSSPAAPAIEAEKLVKRFGDLVAVDGVDFEIQPGERFGFLGPNGAGKTSTMKMIACVSPVTSGRLTVFGMDVGSRSKEIKARIGVVSQSDSLDPDLSVLQNLMSHARYFDLPKSVAERRALEGLELFQLRDKAENRPGELSGGMRRRLLIVRALINEPRMLVLDEPTTGLDPQARLLVWDKLSLLKSQGITMLLTTHYMDEASYLCDRLVMMDHGVILDQGTPDELVRRLVGDLVIEVRVRHDEKRGIMDALASSGIEARIEDRADSLLLYPVNGVLSIDDLGLDLDRFQVTRRHGNLEDAFLQLTGRGLREDL